MASKLVTDRQKSARAVVAAADTHAPEAQARVSKLLQTYLEPGETMPDLALASRLVGRLIAARSEALVSADVEHERELADDDPPRKARDTATETVRRVLVDLRAALETACGMSALPRLHLSEPVPSDPSVLATYGRTVLDALRDEDIKLPAQRTRGLMIDRKAFAEELATELPTLEKALAHVAREAREAEATLRAKRDAMEANDRAFSRGAAWLSATFALAGLDEHASRVRPSGRRPGETTEAEAQENTLDAP
ncbi:hypothetical protein [Polyangium aurulentum]|uniref:hypothetical protein n=1 Tax=Polyangium aurulentum TaxID=2567896 RepID=UPI0010AED7A5|nr:hypothetical protein [Polyangium aurulentum]UQA58114.1 hypothetical protein E8A73_043780 [Polyangium aurulentum]